MDKAEAVRIVSETGWLSRRPESFRTEFLRRCRLRVIEAGGSVYHSGDAPGGMFGLVQGLLHLRLPPAESMLTFETAGFWFGELAAFRHGERLASVWIVQNSVLLYLPQSDFEELVSDAENCRHIALNMAEHLGETLSILAGVSHPDSQVRVVQRLLTFIGTFGDVRRTCFPISQTDLAEMCGLSRQTTGKVLATLEEQGIISLGYRKISVLDAVALRQLATSDERIWR